MITRRDFLGALTSAATAGAVASGCDSDASLYAQAVRKTWAGTAARPAPQETIRFLIRNATLAASSHNTQPWKFKPDNSGITILPDWTRRCPVVDPDDHHLFASLGCACENLAVAARAMGFEPTITFDGGAAGAVRVELARAAVADSQLFNAIRDRQSSRTEYDRKAVPVEQLRVLEASGASVDVLLMTSKAQREQVLEWLSKGTPHNWPMPPLSMSLSDGSASMRRTLCAPVTGCSRARRAIRPFPPG